jgi:hypothetical protein
MQQVDQPMINLETLSQVRKTISIKREISSKRPLTKVNSFSCLQALSVGFA